MPFNLLKSIAASYLPDQITNHRREKEGKVKVSQSYVFASGVVRPPGFEPGIAGLEGFHLRTVS